MADVLQLPTLHQQGIVGQGVRLLLLDDGIGSPEHFARQGFHWQGNAGRPVSHGTGMAALLAFVAPGLTVHSLRLGARPGVALRRAHTLPADLILCAWSVPPSPSLQRILVPLQARLLAVRDGDRLPGAAPGVFALDATTCWPQGPVRFAGLPRTFQGLSVAAAVAAGVAALLLNTGASPSAALQSVTTVPRPHLPDLFSTVVSFRPE